MALILLRRLARLCAAAAVTQTIVMASAVAQTVPAAPSGSNATGADQMVPSATGQALQASKAEDRLSRTKAMLRSHRDQLYRSGAPEIGNPDAKVTIVAFFDYNCPFCRSTYAMLKAFMKENTDIKLVVRDTATFGKDSESVGRVVLAARNQGKFDAMHDALMSAKGKLDEQQALDIAAKLGLDVPRLTTDSQSADVGALLTASQQLARQLKVTGVPMYIIGYRGISGASDDLMSYISRFVDEIRTSGCEVC